MFISPPIQLPSPPPSALSHLFGPVLCLILQGCTKRTLPGCVDMGYKYCILLVGKQKATLSANFSQPGKVLLVPPCIKWTYHVCGCGAIPTIIGQHELPRIFFLDFCVPRTQLFYIFIKFKSDFPRLNIFLSLFLHHKFGAETTAPIIPILYVVIATAEI